MSSVCIGSVYLCIFPQRQWIIRHVSDKCYRRYAISMRVLEAKPAPSTLVRSNQMRCYNFFCLRLSGFCWGFCFVFRCNFHLAFKMHSMLNRSSVRLTLFRNGQACATKRETDKWRGIINVIIMFSYAIRKKCVLRVFSSLVFILVAVAVDTATDAATQAAKVFRMSKLWLGVYTFWYECAAYAIAKKDRNNSSVTT